ncbi:SUKH-4 family immunity protein, partial [Streptomyces sp. WAC01526]|uniref:SUKH-4 family immunity protein n=1 Tax=Streptomyces sp. WAC01526 TaxID=2588709 RepID=UPI0011DF2C6C
SRPTPWFDLIDGSENELKKVGACYADMGDRWENLPENARDWAIIGMVPYDDIALDIVTGAVQCLPQEGEVYPLNKDLYSFAHFLYLLEQERPNYDEELEQELDPEGAVQRLTSRMREIDPEALEVPHSRWHDILEWVAYPDAR